jgi:hypothetical protein
MRFLYDDLDGHTDDVTDSGRFQQTPAGRSVSDEDLRQALQYLEGEGLIKCHWTMGGQPPSVQLRHRGVLEVEQAISTPDRSTEHFVPMVSVFHVGGSIVNSQISAGSPGSQQSGTFNSAASVREFVDAALLLVQELNLGEVEQDLLADIGSIERELDRPEPRQGVIREFGTSIRTVLELTIGGLVVTAMSPEVMKAIDTISSYNW